MRRGINPERDSHNIGKDERSDRDKERKGDSIPYQFIDFAFILKRLTEVTADKAADPDEVTLPQRRVQPVAFAPVPRLVQASCYRRTPPLTVEFRGRGNRLGAVG